MARTSQGRNRGGRRRGKGPKERVAPGLTPTQESLYSKSAQIMKDSDSDSEFSDDGFDKVEEAFDHVWDSFTGKISSRLSKNVSIVGLICPFKSFEVIVEASQADSESDFSLSDDEATRCSKGGARATTSRFENNQQGDETRNWRTHGEQSNVLPFSDGETPTRNPKTSSAPRPTIKKGDDRNDAPSQQPKVSDDPSSSRRGPRLRNLSHMFSRRKKKSMQVVPPCHDEGKGKSPPKKYSEQNSPVSSSIPASDEKRALSPTIQQGNSVSLVSFPFQKRKAPSKTDDTDVDEEGTTRGDEESESESSVSTVHSSHSQGFERVFDDLISHLGSQISGLSTLLDVLSDHENDTENCPSDTDDSNKTDVPASVQTPRRPCEMRKKVSSAPPQQVTQWFSSNNPAADETEEKETQVQTRRRARKPNPTLIAANPKGEKLFESLPPSTAEHRAGSHSPVPGEEAEVAFEFEEKNKGPKKTTAATTNANIPRARSLSFVFSPRKNRRSFLSNRSTTTEASTDTASTEGLVHSRPAKRSTQESVVTDVSSNLQVVFVEVDRDGVMPSDSEDSTSDSSVSTAHSTNSFHLVEAFDDLLSQIGVLASLENGSPGDEIDFPDLASALDSNTNLASKDDDLLGKKVAAACSSTSALSCFDRSAEHMEHMPVVEEDEHDEVRKGTASCTASSTAMPVMCLDGNTFSKEYSDASPEAQFLCSDHSAPSREDALVTSKREDEPGAQEDTGVSTAPSLMCFDGSGLSKQQHADENHEHRVGEPEKDNEAVPTAPDRVLLCAAPFDMSGNDQRLEAEQDHYSGKERRVNEQDLKVSEGVENDSRKEDSNQLFLGCASMQSFPCSVPQEESTVQETDPQPEKNPLMLRVEQFHYSRHSMETVRRPRHEDLVNRERSLLDGTPSKRFGKLLGVCAKLKRMVSKSVAPYERTRTPSEHAKTSHHQPAAQVDTSRNVNRESTKLPRSILNKKANTSAPVKKTCRSDAIPQGVGDTKRSTKHHEPPISVNRNNRYKISRVGNDENTRSAIELPKLERVEESLEISKLVDDMPVHLVSKANQGNTIAGLGRMKSGRECLEDSDRVALARTKILLESILLDLRSTIKEDSEDVHVEDARGLIITTKKAIERINRYLKPRSSRFGFKESVGAVRSNSEDEQEREMRSGRQLSEEMKERDIAGSIYEAPSVGGASIESRVQPSYIKSEFGAKAHPSNDDGDNTLHTGSENESLYDRFGHLFSGAYIASKMMGCAAPGVSDSQICADEKPFTTSENKTIKAGEIATTGAKALTEHFDENNTVTKLVFRALTRQATNTSGELDTESETEDEREQALECSRQPKDAMDEGKLGSVAFKRPNKIQQRPSTPADQPSTSSSSESSNSTLSRLIGDRMLPVESGSIDDRSDESHREVPIRSVEYVRPGKARKSPETIKSSADIDSSHQTLQIIDAIKSGDQPSTSKRSGDSHSSKTCTTADDLTEFEEYPTGQEPKESKTNNPKNSRIRKVGTDNILQDLSTLRNTMMGVRLGQSRDEHAEARTTLKTKKQSDSEEADTATCSSLQRIIEAEEFHFATVESAFEMNATDKPWQLEPLPQQQDFATNWEIFIGDPFSNAAW